MTRVHEYKQGHGHGRIKSNILKQIEDIIIF
jgi:hypothetical protein